MAVTGKSAAVGCLVRRGLDAVDLLRILTRRKGITGAALWLDDADRLPVVLVCSPGKHRKRLEAADFPVASLGAADLLTADRLPLAVDSAPATDMQPPGRVPLSAV